MKEYESIQTLLDPVRNFGKVTVSTGYTNLDTVIVLSTGDGARLPYPTTDGPFNLIWYNWSEYRDPADDPNREIVRVTARTGDIITVTRPEEGTIATNKNLIGRTYKMILSVTAKTISDLRFLGLDVDGKIPAGSYVVRGGNEVINSHNAEVSLVSATYVKKKTITLNASLKGVVRVYFEGRSLGGTSGYGYFRIYKNGVAFGTEQYTANSSFVSFTEDLTINTMAIGETLELWMRSDGTYGAAARNFQLRYEVDPAIPTTNT